MKSFLTSALIGAGVLFFAFGASAQSVDQRISALLNAGQFDQARAVLEASSPTALDRRFFEGRALKATGQLPQAAAVFRAILNEDPSYLNAKRELAHTLLVMRQWDAAENQFRELLARDSNPNMQAGYRQFLAQIGQSKPSDVSLSFGILPSSNVNRGTGNDTFTSDTLGTGVIDPSSQETSGVGVQLEVSGYTRFGVTQSSRWVLNWGVQGTDYKGSVYDSLSGNLALSREWAGPKFRASVTPYIRTTWRGDDADSNALGLRLGGQRSLGANWSGFGSLSHEYRKFDNQDASSGTYSAGSVGVGYRFNSTLSARVGVTLQDSSTRLEYNSYDGGQIFASISKIWAGGLYTSLGVSAGKRDYKDDFPFFGAARRDDVRGINFSIASDRITYRGFRPSLNCQYQRNTSNVALYDYDVTECRIGLQRRF